MGPYADATDVREVTSYLYGGFRSTLNRAGPGAVNTFSDPWDMIPVTIDVSRTGLGEAGNSEVNITVKIHRCYGNTGSCADSPIPVRLKRKAPKWNVKVETRVSGNTKGYGKAKPGDTITFTHHIINNGPDPLSETVRVTNSYSGPGWSGSGRWDFVTGAPAYRWYDTGDRSQAQTQSYTIKNSDVGKTFCAKTYAIPARTDDTGKGVDSTSNEKCVTVAPDWSIGVKTTPGGYSTSNGRSTINHNGNTCRVAKPGDNISFTHEVTQNGPDDTTTTVVGSASRTGKNWQMGKTEIGRWTVYGNWTYGQDRGSRMSKTYYHKVTNDDVGTVYYATTYAKPRSMSNGKLNGGEVSHTACIAIPYDWHSDGTTQIRVSDAKYDNTTKTDWTNHANRTYPGDKLQWKHTARLWGTTKVGQEVKLWHDSASSMVNGGRYTSNPNFKTWRNGTIPPQTLDQWIGSNAGTNNGRLVAQVDVGGAICGRLRIENGDYWGLNPSSAADYYSNTACADVPYHYPACTSADGGCAITTDGNPRENPKNCAMYGNCPWTGSNFTSGGVVPSINHTGNDYVLEDDPYSFTGKVTHNTTGPTKTRGNMTAHKYVFLSRKGYEPSKNFTKAQVFSGGNFQNVACNSGARRGLDASQIKACVDEGSVPVGVLNPGEGMSVSFGGEYREDFWSEYKADAEPGDQICAYIAVNKWAVWNNVETNTTVASNVACVDIAKLPHTKILGADSYADGKITSSSYYEGNTKNDDQGSWSQYGLFSNNEISNFGTNGYTTVTADNRIKACKLTFANITGLTSNNAGSECHRVNGPYRLKTGHFSSNHDISIPDLARTTPDDTRSWSFNNASGKDTGYYKVNDSSINMSGTVNKGNHVTI